MEWFRVYAGMPTDPKWLLVARAAGHGATPGHVVAIWSALLDHASMARPRGDISSVDTESIAASFGWDHDLVDAVHGALVQRRHIVDGCVRTWRARNPEKYDRTATERKQRQRAKQKKAGAAPVEDAPETGDGHAMSRRDMRDGHGSRTVTPTEKIEQSNCSSFDSASRQDTTSSLKEPPPRTVREQAGAVIDADGFWSWLASQGIAAHIGIRTMHRGRLAEWLGRGLTDANLAEALARARKKREQQRSPHPVNLGFLACFVDEVLAGVPATTATNTGTGGGYERGDQLSREFASAR